MKTLTPFLVAGILLLIFSCNRSSNEPGEDRRQREDSIARPVLAGDSVKLIKTASIEFKVKDVQNATVAISELTKNLNGMVFQLVQSYPQTDKSEMPVSNDSLVVITAFSPQAEMTVRVPQENLENLMYSVSNLGYQTSHLKLDIDDQTINYLEQNLKQKNRRDILAIRYQHSKKSFSDAEKLLISDQLTDQQIRNRSIDADVKYSSINLRFFQNPIVTQETIADYRISQRRMPFSHRFTTALNYG